MFRTSLALLIAVAIASLGCASGSKTEGPQALCARPQTPSATGQQSATAGVARAEAQPGFSDLVTAVQDLRRLYINPLDGNRLMTAALAGARDDLSQHGISVPSSFSQLLGQGTPDSRAAFETLVTAGIGSPDARELIYSGLRAMTDSLHDEHTAFIPPPRWLLQQRSVLPFLGVIYKPLDGGNLVLDVVPGSSAQAAGLRPGDLIRNITRQASTSSSVGNFRVSVEISRAGEAESLEAESQEAEPAILKSSLLERQIGYVRLYEFRAGGSCESLVAFEEAVDTAIDQLNEQGARAWILDLRGNPGGNIMAASFLAGRLGYFGLLATAHDRFGGREPFEALATRKVTKEPLVIMVDDQSASASEVIAYSFQEAERARIVGTRTAGAVVGATFEPVAGGALEITIALAEVGSSNHVLDKIGVKPDLFVSLDLDLLMRTGTDSQLNAAVNDLKARLAH